MRPVVLVALLAGLAGGVLAWRALHNPPAPDVSDIRAVYAEGLERRTIYHSPQTPGYTAWVGAWTMPDDSLMTGFVQATGPVDPSARAQAPAELKQRLGTDGLGPEFDFWGLDLTSVLRRSSDGGDSWTTVREDPFKAAYAVGYSSQPTLALRDGSLLRRVNGYDLLHDPAVPHTAYLQRLFPDARSWSGQQVLMDPARYIYQVSRVRRLSDDSLLAMGGYVEAPAGTPHADLRNARSGLLAMVSRDEGRTWRNAVTVTPGNGVEPNEWDAAELPGGDLLAVFRARDPDDPQTQIRQQGILKKRGAGWVLTNVRDAPFPHSGHPELLATREGVILHIATTGVDWTADRGRTWRPLAFPMHSPYRSEYYPRSVQAADGTIYVFGHEGADDPYGGEDQAIVMDRFRLVPFPAPPG